MENWIISNTHFEDEDLVMDESYFDGKVLEIIGVNLFTYLICLVSFGLLLPYSLCYKYKLLANHTIINKKKIVFSGKSLNLIGSYLLSIITFGIYGIWMPVKLYGWKVKNTHIKLKDEKFDITKINTSLNSDKSKSDNQTENVTTKKVVEKTTTVQYKCSNNGIYADGICYDKNSYVYPGSCGYLNEIDGKCYYPGCDETNYLTYENCVNDYANKPISNECPTGFKYIDGLCYGSVIN